MAKKKSDFYRVELTRSFTHLGFTYRPGTHTVARELFELMSAEADLVESFIATTLPK
ncbi:MAG: hypothetical protein ACM3ZV_07405 [Bacillota bacterium]